MAKYHGKSGSATVAGVTMAGTDWTYETDTDEVNVTDFRTASSPAADGSVWDEWLVGFSNGQGTISVLFDDGVAIPAHGASGTITLLYGGGHGITFTAFFRGGQRGTKVKDAGRMTLKFRQTGNPTFA